MATFVTYATYLAISVGLTIAVGSALSRSGRVFLASAFGGDDGLARAASRLPVIGLCLLNLGFVALAASTPGQVSGPRQAFGILFSKIGAELLVLGALYLASIVIFTRLRRRPPGPGPAAGQDRPPARTPGRPGG